MFRLPETEPLDLGHRKRRSRHGWYPPGLRWWILSIAVLLCWIFIAVLQTYLRRSQTNGGLIFAPRVSDLPLHRSFSYLYLPTIIAVFFSIFILWIDHDAKRYEPYRQMSQSGGALAENSILLHYPFDFALFVPVVAARRKHWLVFFASFAGLLTTFAVVPLQAGIFSTKTVVQHFPQDFNISSSFMHSSIQEERLSLGYTQSAYGILKLNETLPAFTARNFTLRPFAASNRLPTPADTWTSDSVLYSMKLECGEGRTSGPINSTVLVEETKYYASPDGGDPIPVRENVTYPFVTEGGFNSSSGCYVGERERNNITEGSQMTVLGDPKPKTYKKYSASYKGYFGVSLATATVSENLRDTPKCGDRGNGTFYASFTRNKKNERDPDNNITAIFCKMSYYEQDVEATINAVTGHPSHVAPRGAKRPISADVFNTTVFEDTLAAGERQILTREATIPVTRLASCLEYLSSSDLTPSVFATSPLMTTVMSEWTDRFEELLDPKRLGEAYESIYQLFFARAMADILKPNSSASETVKTGRRGEQIEAVVLEPVFVYLVEVFLGLISVSLLALVWMQFTDRTNGTLADDPASISNIMSMVANDKRLLESFEDLDCAPKSYFREKLSHRYTLGDDASSHSITTIEESKQLLHNGERKGSDQQVVSEPIRPAELHGFTATMAISLFLALLTTLAVLFSKSRLRGLALPSQDRITRNLIVEYLPTLTATLIEAGWYVINRLLCVLQPLEQMRGLSGARAARSISLNYSSLPPQLTLIKALHGGHILLAVVCAMTLVGNLLTTAFAGLFSTVTLPLSHSILFPQPLDTRFVQINGSSGPPIDIAKGQYDTSFITPSGAYQGSIGESHFFIAESNLTRNTSLPSWTDGNAMYMPFMGSENTDRSSGRTYQARTRYFAAEARCKPLSFRKDYHMRLWGNAQEDWQTSFNIAVPSSTGKEVTCHGTDRNRFIDNYGPKSRRNAERTSGMSCPSGATAAEMVTTLVPGPDATEEENETCRTAIAVGWTRTTQQYCHLPVPGNITEDDLSPPRGFEDAAADNTLLLLCQPVIKTGNAMVDVSSSGVLQRPATDIQPDPDQSSKALEKFFTSGVESVISQSNLFMFRTLKPWWHNDTFASEFMHYFINRAESSLRLTDPNEPLPKFADVEEPMNLAYTRLFAIWLGVNKELLFVPAADTTARIPGTLVTLEKRLVFVTPLFITSEIILGLYIIVTIMIYLRRPGRYLPRMPISIAAIIALFAPSTAVKDLRNTSSMSNKEREKYLKDLNLKYGYGSYVGRDGGVHVGVEKVPFVHYMKEVTFRGSKTEKEISRRKAINGLTHVGSTFTSK